MLQETREAPSKDNEFTRKLCRVSLAAARRRGFDTKPTPTAENAQV